MTYALLPALEVGSMARVINVTAGDKMDPDKLQAEKGFLGLMTYTHSTSVLESMTLALAREIEPKGVKVN